MRFAPSCLAAAAVLGCAACSVAGPANLPPASTWNDLPAVVDGGAGGEAWFARHPTQDVIVFGRHQPGWKDHRLYVTRKVDGRWTEPEIAPFSRGIDASTPHFAPDGRSLLFSSLRGSDGKERPAGSREGKIWRVTWDGAAWGPPRLLQSPVNTPGSDTIDAIEVAGGVIYFTNMSRAENAAKPDIFRAQPTPSGGYAVTPVAAFNTEKTESTLYVTPDESLIVFHRADDPRGLGEDDLFAARRRPDGSWGPEIHLGAGANSPAYEYGPELSPDRSTLYFTTHRDEEVRIMAVDFAATMGE